MVNAPGSHCIANAWFPARPPPLNPRPTLPPEIWIEVLRWGGKLAEHHRGRMSFYCSASLVCVDWCGPSQQCLMDDVCLVNNFMASSWQRTRLRHYQTSRLQLLGPSLEAEGVSVGLARQVLNEVEGLRHLVLRCFYGEDCLSLDDFCRRNLNGITSLELQDVDTLSVAREKSEPLHPSFNLRALSFSNYLSFDSHGFSFFSNAKLEKLEVELSPHSDLKAGDYFQENELVDLRRLLLKNDSTLRHLTINDPSILVGVASTFSSFRQLRHLSIKCDDQAQFLTLLRSLPGRLASLAFDMRPDVVKSLISSVKASLDVSAMADLEHLELRFASRKQVKVCRGGEALMRILERKGVSVIFKGEN